MERELNRASLLEKGLMPRERWIDLKYGAHSSDRKEERRVGSFDVLPNRIKCGVDNIHSACLKEDNSIKKLIVRINYSKSKWLYLVIADGYFVKTVWWRDKKRNTCQHAH